MLIAKEVMDEEAVQVRESIKQVKCLRTVSFEA